VISITGMSPLEGWLNNTTKESGLFLGWLEESERCKSDYDGRVVLWVDNRCNGEIEVSFMLRLIDIFGFVMNELV